MLTTAQAARRLGVKPQTVYAYVSRGMLQRHPGPDGRQSRFDPAEVERLARRARRGGRAGALEVIVDTEITLLDPAGRLFYRGRDATELARSSTFEDVALLLWDTLGTAADWTAPPALLEVARAAQAVLPAETRPAGRLRVAAAALAAADPGRGDRRADAVSAVGQTMIAALVDCLPERGPPRDQSVAVQAGPASVPSPPRSESVAPKTGLPQDHSIAARLWSRLSAEPPAPERLRALDAALILLADHELAASTLAARVAASAWADPYLVALTGLSVLGGALHGAEAGAIEALLSTMDEATARVVVGERLRAGEPVPGFGHAVYRDRDPRADALLALLPSSSVVSEILALAERLGGPAPNVDFALGALSATAGLAPGSAEAIFAVARTAGLLAQAIEEYPHRLRFRPRAAYTGPRPA
jgi:citrate synthase